jgi:hypothetical protein
VADEWDNPLPAFIMVRPDRVSAYEARYLGISRCRELQVLKRAGNPTRPVLLCVWHAGTLAKIYEKDAVPTMPYQPRRES